MDTDPRALLMWLLNLVLCLALAWYNLPAALLAFLGSGLFLVITRRTGAQLKPPLPPDPGTRRRTWFHREGLALPDAPVWLQSPRLPPKGSPAAALLQVDNFDEVLQSTPPESRPQLSAEIDRLLNAWAAGAGIYLQKYAEDKYFALMGERALRLCRDNQFAILDQVRAINAGNLYPVTLSIGVGAGYAEALELSDAAQASLELATGRGGDQTVVKAADGFAFFGARTAATEARSPVKARAVAQALAELIREAEQVFVAGHVAPDLDSLAAALGIVAICQSLGREARIVIEADDLPPGLPPPGFIPREIAAARFIPPGAAVRRAGPGTLLVVVDVNRADRLPAPGLLPLSPQRVVIDHHRRSEATFPDILLPYIEPHASSTAELVTELIQYLPVTVNLVPWEATILLAGIALDTKNFSIQTGARTFAAAAYLRRAGAEPLTVRDWQRDDLAGFGRRMEVFRRAEVICGRVVLGVYPEPNTEAQVLAARAADDLLNIRGIGAALVLCPTKGGVLVSARSLGDFNVQVMLERLGGGGHLMGAGAFLAGCDLAAAKAKVSALVAEFCEGGEELWR